MSQGVEYVVRGGPGAVASGLTLFHIPLDQWTMIAALSYTVLQIAWFVYDKVKKIKNGG